MGARCEAAIESKMAEERYKLLRGRSDLQFLWGGFPSFHLSSLEAYSSGVRSVRLNPTKCNDSYISNSGDEEEKGTAISSPH